MSASARLLTLCACLLAFGALLGCSKKNNTTQEAGLTQIEANDLMQTLMAEAATDSGGWMVEVSSTLLNVAPSIGVSTVGATTTRDTMFTSPNGSVAWTFHYTYYGAGGLPSDSASIGTTRAEASTEARGGFTLLPYAGQTGHGTYHRQTDDFSVDGIASPDTALLFHNSAFVDSGLFVVTSATESRFYLLDNIVTYDLTLSKSKLSAPPVAADAFKAVGQVQINAFVSVLRTFAPGPSVKLLDTVMAITFDGTTTPLATITADTDPATTVYRYRVNLKTGAITPA
jgi:hypothetical protein